jgi:predicted ribosomally synthesized peptide with SipW-like signal peptide
MRRISSSLLVIGAVLALVVGAGTFAVFTDTQTATGPVNSGTINLYLADLGDDTGEDEAIFETTENLLPGETTSWPLRLINTGNRAWDATNVVVTSTESNDPGNDCGTNLTVAYVPTFDGNDHDGMIHANAGETGNATITASLNGSTGNECQNNTWTVTAVVTVTQHP